ncbi:sugar ABC transporter substrate-binding protein [Streptomyces sp. MP131-18]|uniref:ABC transporter substrate-binding protein n=1 Tax=Streptomyces sp. MP131-18 TaxID=1857892 RepID=UPI00097C6932|nr:sugar ABC transporter substrate-binding protein [Streptomyces sp. MP131-18]ONK10530.1 putative arabinose-binding protein precursor [Streptomyces sp. MP131-18]
MAERGFVRGIALAGVASLVAACSGGEAGDGVITLDYWCWSQSQSEKVDAFNAAHPDIQVRHTDAGGGGDSSTKLLTASRAGNAPDISCVEYQTIPAMVVSDVLADISEYTAEVEDDFSDEVWEMTRFEEEVYGIPQDVGPMVLLYNQARFDELGLEVPATWEEFAEVAADVRERDPSSHLATFAPTEFGNFAGLAQQAGADWWTVEDREWTVGIDDEATMRVAEYWQDLIDRDLVRPEPLLTPEWNNRVNNGHVLTWPSALWAPGVLYGVAEGQAGDWGIAPLPQWESDDRDVALQGGTALTVTKNSDHPEAAAEFAMWMNTDETAYDLQIADGQYPACIAGQEAAAQGPPPPLTGRQQDYWDIATEAASHTVPGVTWGPNVSTASDAYQDAISAAIRNGTPLPDALQQVHDTVVEDMDRVGFDISN